MNDDPKNLSHMLNDQSRPFYVTPENIAAAHPLKTGRFDISNAAMILVSERHAKGDLVDLVNAILLERDIEQRQSTAVRKRLHDTLYPTMQPIDRWHEAIGDVLWWKLPVEEPPYLGTPLDDSWPGDHTHWCAINWPKEARNPATIDVTLQPSERTHG